MTNVTAVMKLKDKTIIKLSSLNANYNILDNNTNFFNNVGLNYLNHNITADNIDIFFRDSKVEAYNNLVYRNLDLNLVADKVEINLITKNSKVFMLNDEKIKIFKSN
jgi:lipopolysaccharide assembly outer membrane protein LptD (OstA)